MHNPLAVHQILQGPVLLANDVLPNQGLLLMLEPKEMTRQTGLQLIRQLPELQHPIHKLPKEMKHLVMQVGKQ